MADTSTVETLEYSLSRELDLLAAEGLKGDLLALWQKDGDLTINGADVERVSTPCIEVLVAASIAFKEGGHAFRLKAPSSPLADAFEALGLADRLEVWRDS